MAAGERLTAEDVDGALPPEAHEPGRAAVNGFVDDPARSLVERVEAFEAYLCKDALERTRFVQKEAAAALGLSYDQFRQRYRKYGLGKE
jgi:psp operon transcriptional activator